MRIELMMFDLDGTLIDSRPDIVAQVNEALVAEGLQAFPEERVGRLIGRGPGNLFRRLLGDSLPPPRLDRVVAAYMERYARHMLDATTVYPGVFKALEHYRGVPKAVVTNKPQAFSDVLVDRLGLRGHFQAVFGAEAFAARKPDPLPLLEACRRFGAAPGRAVFVGDSCVDLAASKAAGSVSVSALYGYEDAAALRELGPDFEIGRPAELIGLFD